jgi:hypothetical protein
MDKFEIRNAPPMDGLVLWRAKSEKAAPQAASERVAKAGNYSERAFLHLSVRVSDFELRI